MPFITHESSTWMKSGDILEASGSDPQVLDYNPSDGVTGYDAETICAIAAKSGTTRFTFQNQISSAEEYF